MPQIGVFWESKELLLSKADVKKKIKKEHMQQFFPKAF